MLGKLMRKVRSWWATRQFRANRDFAIRCRQRALRQEENEAALRFMRKAYAAALLAQEFLDQGANATFEEKAFLATFVPTCRKEYRLILTAAMPTSDIKLCIQIFGWGRERSYADNDLVENAISRYTQGLEDLQVAGHRETLQFLYENRYAYAPNPLRLIIGDVLVGITSRKDALHKMALQLVAVRAWLPDYVDSAEPAREAAA